MLFILTWKRVTWNLKELLNLYDVIWTSEVRFPIENDPGAILKSSWYRGEGWWLLKLTAYVERLAMRSALLRRCLRRHGRLPKNSYRQTVKCSLPERRSLL
jgi:hypothetical protein